MPGQASALRCGNKLVDIGDRRHQVAKICGEPDYVDSYEKPVISSAYARGFGYSNVQTFVHIDVWTYNFGSTRFMKELIFQDGVLHTINQLEYGH